MSQGRGIGGHHRPNRGLSDEWLTPPWLLDRLGSFDLDPCTPDVMPWRTAARRYTRADDGLVQPWSGTVWLNPPYSEAARWLAKLARNGDGLALIFARTETAAFHEHVWSRANALLFLRGRLHFCRPCGTPAQANAGGPSVLVAYGAACAERLARSGFDGAAGPLFEQAARGA